MFSVSFVMMMIGIALDAPEHFKDKVGKVSVERSVLFGLLIIAALWFFNLKKTSLGFTPFNDRFEINSNMFDSSITVKNNAVPAANIKHISKYELTIFLNGEENIVLSFVEGGMETISLDNAAQLAGYEAVLKQADVVFVIDGQTKMLLPSHFIKPV